MFKIKPIGGVGQIGGNCTIIEFKSYRLLIDTGALFPLEEGLGVNILSPPYHSLGNIDFLILTHGHEDHIGTLNIFLKENPNAKVYTSNFTYQLLLKKGVRLKNFEIFDKDSTLILPGLDIWPVFVDHSIPETFGVFFNFSELDTSLFFVSDFKMNDEKSYSSNFERDKLKRLSQLSKLRLLFADNTNILSENKKTPAEEEIVPHLDDIFLKSSGRRIFATFFPSNIERFRNFLDLAKRHKLDVHLIGRSMQLFFHLARETNQISYDGQLYFDLPKPSESYRKLILVSGCQADYKSALRSMLFDEKAGRNFSSDDIFVYSAKIIPGNEKKVGNCFNKLAKFGVSIFNSESNFIHVSGHPGKEDLKELIDLTKPTDFVPIHNEYFFNDGFLKWFNDSFPNIKSHIIKNNDELIIEDGIIKYSESADSFLFDMVHDNGLILDRDGHRERRKISESGLVTVFIDSKKVDRFKVKTFGFPFSGLNQIDIDLALSKGISSYKKSNNEEALLRPLKDFFIANFNHKPVIRIIYLD